ncbi:MAG: hypothetical protein AAF471_07120 [Myxococcota bacterium]
MNGNGHPNRFATIAPLLALVTFSAGIAIVIFPTREDMHRHVAQSIQPLADQLNQHVALPTHPAQQRWNELLHARLLSLKKRLEQVEIRLAELKAVIEARQPANGRRKTR